MNNPNTLYANTLADALVATGLRRVCLAPGSRHTPLVLAFARHREAIDLYSHLDERSAAFFALGLALGADEPVALICTSGSAAANFFPAIVEAQQSRLPLIVLTADRPPELRGSGANQTIDQIKLFGDYVDQFIEAPLPEANPPAIALRNLRSLAARAMAMARYKRAVLHINCPFRKPFEPGEADAQAMRIDRQQPPTFLGENKPDANPLSAVLTDDLLGRRGIIYLGHGSCRSEREREFLYPWLRALSRISGYPILAEFTSNMRYSDSADYAPLGAYESFVDAEAADFASAEVLIRLGAPPLCKKMQQILARNQFRYHIYCSRAGEWADDSHSITHHLTLNPTELMTSELENLPSARLQNPAWRERLAHIEARTWQVIDREIENGAYFDGAVLHDVVDLIPAGSTLFVGNSLPVRHLDQFGKTTDKPIFALANRGASGIDGNVSTALGAGAARAGSPLVAVLGDITLYHDMNGLLAVRRSGTPLTLVLLNNDGGGIFHRLPIRHFEPEFHDYFITAHGLDFAQVAALYGLQYARAEDRESFRQLFSASVNGGGSTLIEVPTDAVTDLKRRDAILAAVHQQLASLDTNKS